MPFLRLTGHLRLVATAFPAVLPAPARNRHLVLWVFPVPIGRVDAEMFASFPFGLHNSAYFLADVLGVPFVDDVQKMREIAVLLVRAVDTVVNGDKSHPPFSQTGLRYKSPLSDSRAQGGTYP